ncbi:O-antigen ligase family protein [Neobacillus drentensis]|uniref:O-antigen ligase family protein n=1 Tax=Neobacillus drentensis TaxID=220684 RepID=UPI002FFFA8AB
MALFIFQFGLLQPIALIVNSQLPVAVFTVGLVILMLLKNNFRIKLYVIAYFIFFSLFYLLNGLILSKNLWLTVTLFIGFILKGFSGFLAGSLNTTSKELYNAFLRIGVLNFFVIGTYPFVPFFDSMEYMRFGYAMIPSVIMFWFEVMGEKKYNPIWWGMTIYSTVITVIYGSRGTILVLLLVILLSVLFSKKLAIGKKLFISVFFGIIIYLVIKNDLVIKIIDYLFFDLGIKSYALEKLRMMVIDGIAESSSGRDVLYSSILFYIKQNPVIGYGIGYSESVLGLYPHNIFLQIMLESGFIALTCWLCIWIYCSYKYRILSMEQETGIFKITTLVISVALGRLLVSSDFWLRPEYWFILSILVNYQRNRNLE